jgi:hypothetical protein
MDIGVETDSAALGAVFDGRDAFEPELDVAGRLALDAVISAGAAFAFFLLVFVAAGTTGSGFVHAS